MKFTLQTHCGVRDGANAAKTPSEKKYNINELVGRSLANRYRYPKTSEWSVVGRELGAINQLFRQCFASSNTICVTGVLSISLNTTSFQYKR